MRDGYIQPKAYSHHVASGRVQPGMKGKAPIPLYVLCLFVLQSHSRNNETSWASKMWSLANWLAIGSLFTVDDLLSLLNLAIVGLQALVETLWGMYH